MKNNGKSIVLEKAPMVSIIMPSFNCEDTIVESVNSVLSQTYKNWELIIVDDASTDDTWRVVSRFVDEYDRIKAYSNSENKGAGWCRNFAIEKARGRFIAFLDSDDLWKEDKIEKQISFMLENNYALTYTYYQRLDGSDVLDIVKAPLETDYNKLLFSNVIGCLTAVYDTKKLGKRYMPLIRKRQDMALWLHILKDIPTAHCLPEVLASYRYNNGMSSNKLKVLSYQWELYRKVIGLGLMKSLFVFSVYAYKGFLKHR
ncbi:glycosyltransferase family 2 protein [Salinivibrio sp. IB643]|uniref:glycosyltransferase family 2 protein n=1 Tax=Salinivibrio sp. IB643 TaxID=1909445 RepID=UPI000988E64A|nr:glycosyltransferase family 2 protein [Salinivibrio sp. IB643]OOE93003.1 glycosyl transferase [Salinivibrio sp. IB643]